MSSALQPRSQNPFRRHLPCLVGALALLAGVGCSISEYEEKIEQEQVRLKRFDEDNNRLADAADIGATTPVFFRPPRLMNNRNPTREGIFYVFTPQKANEFQKVKLAYTTEPKEDLEGQVWKELKVSKPRVSHEFVGELSGHKKMPVDKYSYSVPDSVFYVFFYRDPPYQVAVVYQVEYDSAKKDTSKLKTPLLLIDTSMATLVVGDAAKKKKEAFRPRSEPPPR